MMSVKGSAYGIVAVVFLLALSGCKKKESTPAPPVQAVGPSAAEVAKIRDGLTRGTRPVDVSKLSKTQVGKRCVVVARSVPIPPVPSTNPVRAGMAAEPAKMIALRRAYLL